MREEAPRKPITDAAGEARELTEADFAHARRWRPGDPENWARATPPEYGVPDEDSPEATERDFALARRRDGSLVNPAAYARLQDET